mgnify:CR=1 FL=1
MRKDEFLELLDLVLQCHHVRDGLVAELRGRAYVSDECHTRERECPHSPFVRIVDVLERDVLFVLEEAIELGMMSVEPQLGEDKGDICADERSVS